MTEDLCRNLYLASCGTVEINQWCASTVAEWRLFVARQGSPARTRKQMKADRFPAAFVCDTVDRIELGPCPFIGMTKKHVDLDFASKMRTQFENYIIL